MHSVRFGQGVFSGEGDKLHVCEAFGREEEGVRGVLSARRG